MTLMSKAHLKTILFSSAGSGVGKSTVVANLAAMMAEAGRQVIVVDGDMRCPSIHQIFGVAMEPGLSDLLLDLSRLDSILQPTQIMRVRAIAAGSVQDGPALLYPPVISKIMRQLAKDADVVLWDSPPVLAAADTALLAPMADGVMLVVERAQTQREALEAACQQLVDVKAKLLGIIVNRVERDGRYNYYYYRRPTKGSGGSGMLKGIKSVISSYRGKEIFNGKNK